MPARGRGSELLVLNLLHEEVEHLGRARDAVRVGRLVLRWTTTVGTPSIA